MRDKQRYLANRVTGDAREREGGRESQETACGRETRGKGKVDGRVEGRVDRRMV